MFLNFIHLEGRMNTVQLVQTHAVSSLKFKFLSTFPSVGHRLRENFQPTHPGIPCRVVTLVQSCDFIDCFCLSSLRPAGIDCSGLAGQARESEFEGGSGEAVAGAASSSSDAAASSHVGGVFPRGVGRSGTRGELPVFG